MMQHTPKIAFVGTSRSGLGHLRRLSTIAQRLADRLPGAELLLVAGVEVFAALWWARSASARRGGCLDGLRCFGFPQPCLTPNAAVATLAGPCFGAGVFARPLSLPSKGRGPVRLRCGGGVGAADLEVR